MLSSGVRPNLFHYGLLLKAVRDCGVGPPELLKKLPPRDRESISSSKVGVMQSLQIEQRDSQRER